MIKLSSDIEAKLSQGASEDLSPLDMKGYVAPGVQLRYHMPDTYTALTFRAETADYFQKITESFDEDWAVVCENVRNRMYKMIDGIAPLKDTPYKCKRPLQTNAVECEEACEVSDHCLGYALSFHYKNHKDDDFSIQFVYDSAARMIYLTWSFPSPDEATYDHITNILLPVLMQNRNYHFIPNTIDDIDGPIYLPGGLSEQQAKDQIDQILMGGGNEELPYVFFTKMLGFTYPVVRLAPGDPPEIIEKQMFLMRGLCHPVMIETRSLAAYIASFLSKLKLSGMKTPSATSGFALLVSPHYNKISIARPDDCIIDDDTGEAEPLENKVMRGTAMLITLGNDPNTQLTIDGVVRQAKAEREAREAAVKQSEIYKALEAENTALKEQIAKLKSAPVTAPAKDDSYVQALEDKCEALRVENGQLKLRNDALLDTNTALRKKKAKDEHSIILSAEGIPEMYDNELYIQIMALLNDALPGLRTAGAVRRAEIVESVLKANSYHGEIESIHDELVRTSKSGRRDDLFAVLAKYGVTVDNKSHPALYFANGSAAHETVSGTPSDRNALVNAAKHIAKSMF